MPPRTEAYVIVAKLTHHRRKLLFIRKNLFRIQREGMTWPMGKTIGRVRDPLANSIPQEKRATTSEMFISLC
jgi:hypothetical protein